MYHKKYTPRYEYSSYSVRKSTKKNAPLSRCHRGAVSRERMCPSNDFSARFAGSYHHTSSRKTPKYKAQPQWSNQKHACRFAYSRSLHSMTLYTLFSCTRSHHDDSDRDRCYVTHKDDRAHDRVRWIRYPRTDSPHQIRSEKRLYMYSQARKRYPLYREKTILPTI
jgi:hypothetical protein